MGPEEQQYDPILAQYEQERLQNEQEIRELTAEVVEAKLILLEAKKLTECALTAQAGDWIAVEPTFTKIRNFIASPTGSSLLAKMERMEEALKKVSLRKRDCPMCHGYAGWFENEKPVACRNELCQGGKVPTDDAIIAQQALDAGKESK